MGGKVNIYKLINIINKKIYVGKTAKSLEERKIAHIKKAEAKTNRYLYDAMNKYKYENFEITLIEEVDWFLSDEREKYWIDYYHSNDKQFGYNMTAGGGGGDTWTYTSQENKNRRSEALSKSNRGQKRSPKTIQKMIEACKNKPPMSQEARKKISEAQIRLNKEGKIDHSNNWMKNIKSEDHPFFGKKHTKEAREKISLARTGKTYEEIFGVEKAIIQKEKRRNNWLENKNPNYKFIDFKILMRLIDIGYNEKSMSKYFNVSPGTISYKFKKQFRITLTEYRKNKNIKLIKENIKINEDFKYTGR